jgi:hypothetical protein
MEPTISVPIFPTNGARDIIDPYSLANHRSMTVRHTDGDGYAYVLSGVPRLVGEGLTTTVELKFGAIIIPPTTMAGTASESDLSDWLPLSSSLAPRCREMDVPRQGRYTWVLEQGVVWNLYHSKDMALVVSCFRSSNRADILIQLCISKAKASRLGSGYRDTLFDYIVMGAVGLSMLHEL